MNSPLTGKEMVLLTRPLILEYRGNQYTINFQYYLCEGTGEEFTDTELDTMNLQELWDQYDEDLLNLSTETFGL
jgi:hypothetical protein